MYWQQVPIGWRDAPAVVSLGVAVGCDPRPFLLDTWEWALQHGFTHPVDGACLAIETAAAWRGEPGQLFAAMIKSGWLVISDDMVTIVKWQQRIAARHIDAMSTEGMTKAQIAKAQAALRAKRYRDRKSMEAASRTVTPRHAPSRTVTRDASRPTVTQTVTNTSTDDQTQHETGQNKCVTLPSRLHHASRTEVEVEVELPEKNLPLFLTKKDEVKEKAPRGRPPKDTPEIVTDRERWLAKARSIIGLTPEETPAAKALCIRFAQQRKLRGMEQLMRSLDGLTGDPWASKQGLMTLLSDTLIEKGLAKFSAGASGVHVSRVQHRVGSSADGYDPFL